MINKSIGLIILAAGNIGHKLPFIKDATANTAMIPVGMYPVISYLFNFYADKVSRIVVVCNPKSKEYIDMQWELVKQSSLINTEFQVVEGATIHVVDSLNLALNAIGDTKIDDWIITPVTTIPTIFPKANQYLVEDFARASGGWSFVIATDQRVKFISRNEGDQDTLGNAFTGVFRAPLQQIKEIILNNVIDDLIQLVESMIKVGYVMDMELVEWVDIGHAVNYYQAKSKLVTSRHFNSIEIDSIKGLVTKKSTNVEKISAESTFVKTLPAELQIWFPRQIGNVEVSNGVASQKMEYYAYPTVAEVFLYWQLERPQWRQFIKSIEVLLTSFKKFPADVDLNIHMDLYVNKIIQRVTDFQQQAIVDSRLWDDSIVINGNKLKNFSSLIEWIRSYAEKIYEKEHHFLMHGDLCFNNILYDPYGGTIRLIDPRGQMSVGTGSSLGDIKYDLAKLTHSAIYGYDYLIAGLFDLSTTQDSFEYAIRYGSNQNVVGDLTRSLIQSLDINLEQIDFIVGLLFVSMASLHSENKRRQIVMYLHGLNILNRVYRLQ